MQGNAKLNTTLQILLLVGIVIAINVIGGSFARRIDLTDDQRHTISKASADLLENLNQSVFVTVYYGGNLPTHYKQMEEQIRTLLIELQQASDYQLDYQFVNPDEDPTIFRRFAEKQLFPFRVSTPTSYTAQTETRVLPYAQITVGQEDVMINLINNCIFRTPDGQMDFSVSCALQRFEYNLISSIYNMTREKFKTVGFLVGHDEYPKEATGDLQRDLDHYYNFIQVDLRQGKPIGPSNLDLLIVMQPDSALSDREVYEIDQYIMRGGRAIFLVDNEILDFRIGEQMSTFTFLRNSNLDLLFNRMGVKVNANLVKDLSCGQISLESYTTAYGNESRRQFWPYYPLIRNFSGHPTTRYINRAMMRYAGSIDTFAVEGLRKTVLCKSSPNTWLKNGTQFINIDQEVQQKPDPKKFVDGGQIMGLLLEGSFTSAFALYGAPQDPVLPPPSQAALKSSRADTDPRVIIISDGEFAVADVVNGQARRLPEENKTLMMNLIDYMTGQDIITQLRVRNFHDRMLDREKVFGRETLIQAVNIGLPVILVILFGVGRSIIRRRRNKNLKIES
ncbi:MAG: Gldg family protein [Bacteroidota bacterium]